MRLIPLVFVFVLGCSDAYSGKETGDIVVIGTFLDFIGTESGPDSSASSATVLFLDARGQLQEISVDPASYDIRFEAIPQPGDQFRLMKTGDNDYIFEITSRAEDAAPPERL